MTIEYKGHTFPGYNQPIASNKPGKKKMVLAKKGDQVKLIHYGDTQYRHNYSDKAKASYLARAKGIRNKAGQLTSQDKLSANYWAIRDLWPSGKSDGSSKFSDGSRTMKEKSAGAPGAPSWLSRLLGADLSHLQRKAVAARQHADSVPDLKRSGVNLRRLHMDMRAGTIGSNDVSLLRTKSSDLSPEQRKKRSELLAGYQTKFLDRPNWLYRNKTKRYAARAEEAANAERAAVSNTRLTAGVGAAALGAAGVGGSLYLRQRRARAQASALTSQGGY
jgi:hypothetical protein